MLWRSARSFHTYINSPCVSLRPAVGLSRTAPASRGGCRSISIRRVNLRCPHATTASRQASQAGKTGSSSHAWVHLVAQFLPPAGIHNHRVRIPIGWKPALRGFMQRGPRCVVSATRNDLRRPLRGFRQSDTYSFPQIGLIFQADQKDLFGRFRFCVGSPP